VVALAAILTSFLESVMRNAALFLFVTLAIASLSGCDAASGKNPYPATPWGPLDTAKTAEGCPQLSGTYRNVASGSFPRQAVDPPRLADLFERLAEAAKVWDGKERPDRRVPRDAELVTISQDENSLTFSFIDSRGIAHPLRFRQYHPSWSETNFDELYVCKSGEDANRLQFFYELDRAGGGDAVYAGEVGTTAYLLRAADGALIVQLRTETIGMSLLIIGSEYTVTNVWQRYPAVRAR
jgi:hypothetical protein